MANVAPSAPAEERTELKRAIGPGLLLLFIIGDILGTGIYALTGSVAKQVGGMVWLPFLIAFIVAFMTAFSYLELVTKYPQAAGAALYTHKAFKKNFFTFMIAFIVMCSGITSAATASRAFSENLLKGFHLTVAPMSITLWALGFILLVMCINFIGVGESVKANVILTCIEILGLVIVIAVGFIAMSQGNADFSQAMVFKTQGDKSAFLAVSAATSLAFFAMVGFEDSVNMAEETHNPSKTFPKIMITGLLVTAAIYMLVSITAVAIIPPGELSKAGATPLLMVVEKGAPGLHFGTIFPFISMCSVANTALLNLLMASRLLYGMSKQYVLPPVFGLVHKGRRTPWFSILFTSLLAAGLILLVSEVKDLGGTTALLLLIVFTVVNVAVVVLRNDDPGHEHFHAPKGLPVVAGLLTFYLVGPWTGRDVNQYKIAGWLILIGLVLAGITELVNRKIYHQRADFDEFVVADFEEELEEDAHK